MLEAEPSALRNREPIQGTGIKARGLGQVCSKCFSASRDHLLDCSVYYGSKNQYTVAIFLDKMASRFAALVSDYKQLKLRSSAIPVKTNACTEWGVKLWADWSRARAV